MSVTPPDGPGARPDLRASHAERDAVAGRLRDALAEGRITLEEFDERTTRLYRTTYLSELAALTADLPAAGGTPGAPSPVAYSPVAPSSLVVPRSGATPVRRIAVMSGHEPEPPLHVAAEMTLVAVMGGVHWDLRGAVYAAPVCRITAWAWMGGIEILVPDEVDVVMTGGAVMGGSVHPRDARVPGAPVRLEVRARALMGGVEVFRPRSG